MTTLNEPMTLADVKAQLGTWLNEKLISRAEYNANGITEGAYLRGYIDAMREAHDLVVEYDLQRGKQ